MRALDNNDDDDDADDDVGWRGRLARQNVWASVCLGDNNGKIYMHAHVLLLAHQHRRQTRQKTSTDACRGQERTSTRWRQQLCAIETLSNTRARAHDIIICLMQYMYACGPMFPMLAFACSVSVVPPSNASDSHHRTYANRSMYSIYNTIL